MASYNQSPLATADERQQVNVTRVTNPSHTIDYTASKNNNDEETVVIKGNSPSKKENEKNDLTTNKEVKNESKNNKQ